MTRSLQRSRDDKVISGVIAGLARHFGLDPGRARLAYVALSVLSAAFPGILVYLVLWFLLPEGDGAADER